MDIVDIKNNAINLKRRIEGVNSWIESNPQVTDPNMYEYMDLFVSLAEIVRQAREYFDNSGYPKINQTESATHYDIISIVPEISAARDELSKLEKLRNIKTNQISFFKENAVSSMLTELGYRCFAGEYIIPANPDIARIKKEAICKSISVPFYIWQVHRENPNYKYDNITEFNSMKDMYELVKESTGIEVTSIKDNDKVYNGPQFGEQIEKLFDLIDRDYLYSEKGKEKHI